MLRLCALLALAVATATGCGPDHYVQRGERALEAMDLVDAERSFRSALARDAEHVEALYGLGWTYHLAGHQDEARETFERCTQVEPENALGFKGLGSIALAQGNLEVAQSRYEQALQRAPEDPSVRNSVALLHIRAERFDEALELYDALAAEHPERLEHALGRAEALLRLGRLQEALEAVDGALASGEPNPRQATLLHVLRARVLHAHTTGRIDPERCDQSAPPLLAWLDEADRELELAEAHELELENLPGVRREIHQRRKLVIRGCPAYAPRDQAD